MYALVGDRITEISFVLWSKYEKKPLVLFPSLMNMMLRITVCIENCSSINEYSSNYGYIKSIAEKYGSTAEGIINL
jgi:hypothetical protein